MIYCFHSEAFPLYLLTVYGKGEKADLNQAERNELAKLVQVLKGHAKARSTGLTQEEFAAKFAIAWARYAIGSAVTAGRGVRLPCCST